MLRGAKALSDNSKLYRTDELTDIQNNGRTKLSVEVNLILYSDVALLLTLDT